VFQIVFSASPERLAEAGWELGGSNTRLLTPEAGSESRIQKSESRMKVAAAFSILTSEFWIRSSGNLQVRCVRSSSFQ
jgi:hypothetical protein